MRLSRAAITLACGLGLALGGCGGSSESSSPVAGTTSRPTTTTATGAPTSTSPSRTASPAAPTHTTVSTSAAGATTSRPAAAAPSAPDGLRPGGSYSAYDNCTGACGGSVPASLLRPLHLPGRGCTPSGAHTIGGMSVLGQGPVGPAQAARQPFTAFINSRWNGARVTWLASSAYTGPILIRGRELAGAHAVGFGLGNVPYDQLQLKDSAGPSSGGTRRWPAFSRVRGPGCYAYQIDGTSFSDVIVFRAG